MNTAWMIRLTIALIWGCIICAGFGVARFYDLVVIGWPALMALVGIMIGGKTLEAVKDMEGKK